MEVPQAPDRHTDRHARPSDHGVDRLPGRRGSRVPPAGRRRATIEELRAELTTGRLATTIPTEPALESLFPGRGLRKGAVYSVAGATQASTSLLFALLAGPSRAGLWCGVAGMPGFGVEAAAGFGVDLRRLVLVPTAGARWLEALGALADVLDVVVVRPETEVPDSQARRLAARLRERGTVLIVLAPGREQSKRAGWPGCELRFDVPASTWTGLGHGHGHLLARRVTIEATGRGAPQGRSIDLWLPDRQGEVRLPAGEPERSSEPPVVVPFAADARRQRLPRASKAS